MSEPVKLLVLDLDETLVHATATRLELAEDFCFEQYYVYKRPFLTDFLNTMFQHFKLAVWSSASDNYVTGIVQRLMPDTVPLEFIWGRSRCTYKRDLTFDTFYFEKRLEKLKKKGWRMEQIIMVDDSPEKTRSNYGNAVYVSEFTGGRHDDELQHLGRYLLTLNTAPNVRAIEKRGWRGGIHAEDFGTA